MKPPRRVRLFVLGAAVVRVGEVVVVHGDGDAHWGHLEPDGAHRAAPHAVDDEPYLGGAFVVGAFGEPFGGRHSASASFGVEAGAVKNVIREFGGTLFPGIRFCEFGGTWFSGDKVRVSGNKY